jgi:hypothetical protein
MLGKELAVNVKAFLAVAVVLAALSPSDTQTHRAIEAVPGCPDATPQSAHGFVQHQQLDTAPDFIAVSGVHVPVRGYVNRDQLMRMGTNDHVAVCDESLTTTVGYFYAGRGFAPLGVDPETVRKSTRCFSGGSADGSIPRGPTPC